MAQSNIEWTEMTWNPTTGCSKVSAGCKFCYAEALSKRLKAMGHQKYQNGFEVTQHPEALKVPYTWRKPRLVFVNSMSDLFHEEVEIDFIQDVFKVMRENPKHTFQILTKRSERLKELSPLIDWPENVWMGVSVEDYRVKDRIDHLRNTGAFIKFLSLEPLIGPVYELNLENIDWAIVGGESGPKARPLKKEWITNIKKQCKKSGVPFFFKQWGKPDFNPASSDPTIKSNHPNHAKGGCLLNGKIYREFPSLNLIKN